jgi:hypothetical protein
MNRWSLLPSRRFSTLLIVILVWLASLGPGTAAAQTQLRQFPAAARRATLQVVAPPEVLINGTPARLSPGARIRGSNNLLVMSASLVGSAVLVNYLRDGQGLIHEVWILNAVEALESRPLSP